MKKFIFILSILFFVIFSFPLMAMDSAAMGVADDTGIEEGNRLLQEFIKTGRNVTLAEFLEKVHPEVYATMDEQEKEIASSTPMWTKELIKKEFPQIDIKFEMEEQSADYTPQFLGGGYVFSTATHLGSGQISYSSTSVAGTLIGLPPVSMSITSTLYQVDGNDLLLRHSSFGASSWEYNLVVGDIWATQWPGYFKVMGHHMINWGSLYNPPVSYGYSDSGEIHVVP